MRPIAEGSSVPANETSLESGINKWPTIYVYLHMYVYNCIYVCVLIVQYIYPYECIHVKYSIS
jgi:hypothetical protein